MKLLLFVLSLSLLLLGPVYAQVDTTPNGVGIYADLGGLQNEVELEVGTPLEVYLLLTRPSGTNALGGWECGLVIPDNVTIWGWNVPTPGAISLSEPPNFMVGHPEVPYQTINLLMTFILVPLDSEPAQFYITRSTLPNAGDVPRYVDDPYLSSDEGTVEMIPYEGGAGMASFVVNAGPLATSSSLWGDVKALYR